MTARKRRPAASGRIIAGGASTATMLAIVSALSASPAPASNIAEAGTPTRQQPSSTRIVVTDDRISDRQARVAARRALRAGRSTAFVTVEPAQAAIEYVYVDVPVAAPAAAAAVAAAPAPAPHTTTRAS